METRKKSLNIIWPHLAFIFAFPCYLSTKYETVDLRKVYIASILIFISMVCLFFAAKKYEVITKTWLHVFLITLGGIFLSFLIFGYPVAWIIQRI